MTKVEDWVLKHTPRILSILAILAGLLIGTAVYILTQYQPKTACQTNPVGRECQQIKVESDKARTPRSACVITKLAGLGCPALEDRRQKAKVNDNRDDRQDTRQNGDPDAPASPEPQPTESAPSPSGPSPAPDGGGSTDGGGGQPAPPEPSPEPPAPPAPTPPAPGPSPAPPQSPGGIAGTGLNPELPIVGPTCNLTPILCQ